MWINNEKWTKRKLTNNKMLPLIHIMPTKYANSGQEGRANVFIYASWPTTFSCEVAKLHWKILRIDFRRRRRRKKPLKSTTLSQWDTHKLHRKPSTFIWNAVLTFSFSDVVECFIQVYWLRKGYRLPNILSKSIGKNQLFAGNNWISII